MINFGILGNILDIKIKKGDGYIYFLNNEGYKDSFLNLLLEIR